MAKELLKGNAAAGEAAVRAGADFFAGYPITPSTEILEYLSSRMGELGRTFIQAESEIAAVNMVLGASAAGARCITASSGTGISLKMEGYSYAESMKLPFVVVNVQRHGVGLGGLDSGQSDYFRETKGGGQGDYRRVVYAPSSIQEQVDMIYKSFDVAEKYRIGVTIFSEAVLGQMMEAVDMPPFKKREGELDWGIDGTGKKGIRNNKWTIFERVEMYHEIEEQYQEWENINVEDAEYVFVAAGLPARVCIDTVKKLREKGEKVGLIRLKTLWPYPVKAFKELGPNLKGLISVETNVQGQMVEDVALTCRKFKINAPIYCYAYGPGVPMVKEIVAKYEEVKSGKCEERF